MNPIHPAAAAGFSRVAELYERARPTYPAEAVAWLAERTGMGPGKVVVDVGAGTGKLTRLLPPTGARVIAVEPLPEMRALIEGVEAVDGTAEELPFPDGFAAAIVAAQAFHWFDHERALPELHRVLEPGGRLGLIWNSRDLADPLQRELGELLEPYRADVADESRGELLEPLERSPLFGPIERWSCPHVLRYTADDLCARVASTSFVAALPPLERDVLIARTRGLTVGLEEPFPFVYRTDVYAIPRSGDQPADGGGTSNQG